MRDWKLVVPSHAAQGVLELESVSAKPTLHWNAAHEPMEPGGVYEPAGQGTHGVLPLESSSMVPAAQIVQMLGEVAFPSVVT